MASSSTSSPVTLSVTTAPISAQKDDQHIVHVAIKTNEGTQRTKSDIVAVVDVSGSMGTQATLKTATGTEGHGLSLLDLVVHSVKTIVSSLNENDRFALVTYASSASVVIPLTACTETAVAGFMTKLDALRPTSSTNIWAGLESGLQLLEKSGEQSRMKSLLLLTDGQPTESPQGGEVAELQRYKDSHKSLSCTISTFGFGYGIRSGILLGLAQKGGGMYSFIPDGSFVGTAFVNALTNILVTTARDVKLTLETTGNSKVTKVVGTHPSLLTTWGASVEVFTLQHGQTKDIIFVLNTPGGKAAIEKSTPFVTVGLTYILDESTKEIQVTVDAPYETTKDEELQLQYLRSRLVDAIDESYVGHTEAVKQLIKDIEAAQLKDKRAADLLIDLTGQVTEALSSTEFYSKWGAHYLPSLARSHLMQQCNNFKDPGIQHYGGKLFHENRDLIDDIFIKLPAPKPTVHSYSPYGSSSASSAPVSMSSYYCSANPCFAGESLVKMMDGSSKMVKNIRKGDVVMSSHSSSSSTSATVSCVVKTLCANGKTRLVELENGLLVTPYHPVRVESNVWKFPCEMSECLVQDGERVCEAVYSFVLEKDHVMVINGYEVVSLGHSFQEPVVAHAYFGSERVIADLKKMGSDSGLIELEPGCLMRNESDGLVTGFNPTFVRQTKLTVEPICTLSSCQASF